MREVTHGDAVAVAALLARLPPGRWDGTIGRLVERAHAADLYRKRLGRAHPRWGNGTLMSVVLCDSDIWPEPRLSDPVYCEALVAVLSALVRRRRRN